MPKKKKRPSLSQKALPAFFGRLAKGVEETVLAPGVFQGAKRQKRPHDGLVGSMPRRIFVNPASPSCLPPDRLQLLSLRTPLRGGGAGTAPWKHSSLLQASRMEPFTTFTSPAAPIGSVLLLHTSSTSSVCYKANDKTYLSL